ncbi:MAG: phosphoribosylanthranilate isomerase [Planctomycetota bacterium]|nr:phosphoribosylanthranilate isomerase [Planctomycetota bacterium]
MVKRRVRVKVCCISNTEEARIAVSLGADALGLVSKMPSGPGVISESDIQRIAATVPPPISRFLLTSELSVNAVLTQQELVRVDTIQLVDEWSIPNLKQLRVSLPGIRLVQVIHVVNECTIVNAARLSPYVDALLLDSGSPEAANKELGGTGRVHNWSISRQIVERSRIPVFLAGGLRAENIEAALTEVQPFGVDLCSGVRTNNHLVQEKLRAFIDAVRRWECGQD